MARPAAAAVEIGGQRVGPGHPTYVVAEIGINHNGNLDIARKLISAAVLAGCDAVKFQKRTIDVVFTPEELNLSAIPMLAQRYGVPIGYSGHEIGLSTSLAAATLGACMIERHITLDRAMWGSDQAASVEPHGFARLVRDIRTMEAAMGDGRKVVYDSELPKLQQLRRVG